MQTVMARIKKTTYSTRLHPRDRALMPPFEGNSSSEPTQDSSFADIFREIDDYADHGEERAASSSERTLGDEARQGVCANPEEVLAPPLAQIRRGVQEEANLLPSKIHPDQGCMRWLDKHDADYRDGLCIGEGYELRVPTDMESTVSLLADGEFPVYAAAIKLGMRFPPHLVLVDVLDGFNIGVA
ncbi:uncharacterized protein [Spinacia oleracea]|uniref:Uncharacterized protein n=1 Tax=Spinacia oleracea TaxID=3562 RepID=A0ABM3R6C8_SPIOL|nr:uncharacterized protein LOC130466322 [Spinacia oleracea]